MNSCLYECTIRHERRSPKEHKFVHKIFMFYLDLQELLLLSRHSWLLGYNQARAYNFRDQDHINIGFKTVRENILAYLKVQGVQKKVERIQLMTNMRTLGYIFNPVSFYFCFDADDKPVCVVSEIGNTFGELKYFYLGLQQNVLLPIHCDHQQGYRGYFRLNQTLLPFEMNVDLLYL